jgi:hypothetical protein
MLATINERYSATFPVVTLNPKTYISMYKAERDAHTCDKHLVLQSPADMNLWRIKSRMIKYNMIEYEFPSVTALMAL